MTQRIIGILAGMGPRSTTPFLEMVLDQCQRQYNAKYDIDYPQIMVYSLPTPFYIDRQIDHILMKNTIIEGLRKLASTNAAFIAMPCNSAHIYFEELKDSIGIPLLNIVEETVRCLPVKAKRVTMFATETTFNAQIYQQGIIDAGSEFVFCEDWQYKVNKIIQMIKMKEDKPEIILLWKALMTEVKDQNIDTVIIACTDLSMLKDINEHALNIIDSSEALAKVVVSRYLAD